MIRILFLYIFFIFLFLPIFLNAYFVTKKYPNMEIKSITEFSGIKKINIEKFFYKNNKLKKIINWSNGKKNGKEITYWNNGNIAVIKNYRNNKLDGEVIGYNYNGIKNLSVYFNNGNFINGFSYNKEGKKSKISFEILRKLNFIK